jgi:hypothetical protein
VKTAEQVEALSAVREALQLISRLLRASITRNRGGCGAGHFKTSQLADNSRASPRLESSSHSNNVITTPKVSLLMAKRRLNRATRRTAAAGEGNHGNSSLSSLASMCHFLIFPSFCRSTSARHFVFFFLHSLAAPSRSFFLLFVVK